MPIGLTDELSPLGAFPLLRDNDLYGGYRVVADVTARDAITSANRKVGMLVYTTATDATYRLGPGITNGDWTLITSGTITGSGTASVVPTWLVGGSSIQNSTVTAATVILGSGAGSGAGAGQTLQITAGAGGATGIGGPVTIQGGAGGATSGKGGIISILPGAGTGTNQPGGDLVLAGGISTGTGVDGSIIISTNNSKATRLQFLQGSAPVGALTANTVSILAPTSVPTAYALTLPTAQGAASTFLQNNGSGVLSWVAAGGVTGTGTVGNVPAWATSSTLSNADLVVGTISLLSRTATSAGNGQNIIISSGGGFFPGAGGNVSIRTGQGNGIASTLTITAGDTNSGVGGSVTVSSGAGTGTSGHGGDISILAGSGSGSTAIGGNITVTCGNGGSSGGGGLLTLRGGSCAVSGFGGGISLFGGAGVGTNQSGGGIWLSGGASTGTGADGYVAIRPNSSGRATKLGLEQGNTPVGASLANTISIYAPASVTAHNLVLPGTQGAASTFLQNNGSGVLSWVAAGGGVTGTGTTNTVPVWSGASSIANSNAAAGTVLLAGTDAAQGGILSLRGGTSSTAANAGGALNLAGGTPGATGTGGDITCAGGAGGSTSGAGGTVTFRGGHATTTGAGGTVNILGGNAAQSGATAGVAGGVVITGGTGVGNISTGSSGGPVTITGGAAGNTFAVPGDVTVSGGTGNNSVGFGIATLIGGAGGVGRASVVVTGGFAASVTITGGIGSTTGFAGGAISITGGNGAASGGPSTGGAITVVGGDGGGGSGGAGGAVTVRAGNATTSGVGGVLTLLGGTGVGTNQNGGNIVIAGGISTGTGADGSLVISTTNAKATRVAFLQGTTPVGTAVANAISIFAPASVTAHNLVLPGTQGAASTFLQNNGSGVLSWAAAGGAPGAFDATVTTTNTTATLIHSYTPTGNSKAISLQFQVWGSHTTLMAQYVVSSLFRIDSGGTITERDTYFVNGPYEEDAAWDVTMGINAGAIEIKVTGATTNVNWRVTGTILEHSLGTGA